MINALIHIILKNRFDEKNINNRRCWFFRQLSIDYFKRRYKLYLIDKKVIKQKNFLKVDIKNFKEVNDTFQRIKPDIVLHYASEIFDTNNKSQINNNNIDGTFNLVKAAKNLKLKNLFLLNFFNF